MNFEECCACCENSYSPSRYFMSFLWFQDDQSVMLTQKGKTEFSTRKDITQLRDWQQISKFVLSLSLSISISRSHNIKNAQI